MLYMVLALAVCIAAIKFGGFGSTLLPAITYLNRCIFFLHSLNAQCNREAIKLSVSLMCNCSDNRRTKHIQKLQRRSGRN